MGELFGKNGLLYPASDQAPILLAILAAILKQNNGRATVNMRDYALYSRQQPIITYETERGFLEFHLNEK